MGDDSAQDQATVRAQRLAGDHAGHVGDEEGDRRGDVPGHQVPADRLPRPHRGERLGRGSATAAGVGVSPGATQLTVIPSRPSERASVRAMPTRAALLATYASRSAGRSTRSCRRR